MARPATPIRTSPGRRRPIRAGFYGLGIGVAVANGSMGPAALDRKALGSQILFHPSAEIGINLDTHSNISLYLEHMSNGNTRTYNEAIDDLGVRYGFKF